MICDATPNAKAIVDDYCRGVMSGEIVAGKLVRQAVKRHLDDLEHASERGWVFDEGIAARAVAFFPLFLRHSIGEWAGETFELSPWQTFVTWVLYGWQDAQSHVRRYRKALISVARKNGKTTWAAGIALKGIYHDEPVEEGARVYCAATKRDQAKLLFDESIRMIEGSIFLSGLTTIRRAPNRATFRQTQSVFEPVGADSKGTDGLNPHAVIADELHAWREPHRDLKRKLETGGASRRQPLEVIITTAGDDESLLWIEEDDYARSTLEYSARGEVFDDRYFAYIATIDEGDDPLDESVWAKANPNLGVSVKLDYLRDQARMARNAPSMLNQFIRYCVNSRTAASERAISDSMWSLGARPMTIKPGDTCHGGIDLGRTNDWCALALCFPMATNPDEPNRSTRWELLVKCWTCTDGRFDVRREPFASWIKAGLLNVSRGNAISHAEVEAAAVAWADQYSVLTWAYDTTFARDFAQRLQDLHGMPIFSFSQSHRFYNEPLRRLIEHELPAGNIIHGGDPVLAWQAANLQIDRNPRDEWMPDKARSRSKIDGMVASLMAFSECLFAEKNQLTYYDTHPAELA